MHPENEKRINYKSIIERIVKCHQEKLNDWELEFISNQYQWHVLDGNPISITVKENILKINKKMLRG